MRIFRGFDNLPVFRNPVVTVGSFDGVHAGHRQLLSRAVSLAGEMGGESVLVTFDPHPRQLIEGDECGPILLTGTQEKAMLLARAGIDNMVVVPFTEEFRRTDYKEFVRGYLTGRIGMRRLVAGYDHHFGHRKEGNNDSLRDLSRELGFEVSAVPQYLVGEANVSSSEIRRHISAGRMAEAAQCLTYPYFIVARRDGETATAEESCKLLPPPGSYPVRVARLEDAVGSASESVAAALPVISSDSGRATKIEITEGGAMIFADSHPLPEGRIVITFA